MEPRLTLHGVSSSIAPDAAAKVLLTGGRHRLAAASLGAHRALPGRLSAGQTVRSVFPERDARATIALLDQVYDTADNVEVRHRLWSFVPYMSQHRPEIDVTIRPVFRSEDSDKVAGVVAEAHYVRPVLSDTTGLEVQAPRRSPGMGIPGALAFFEGQALGFTGNDAVSLVEIRQAARDAMVEAAGPLVEELRRLRRGEQSGLQTHPEYRPPRPA